MTSNHPLMARFSDVVAGDVRRHELHFAVKLAVLVCHLALGAIDRDPTSSDSLFDDERFRRPAAARF